MEYIFLIVLFLASTMFANFLLKKQNSFGKSILLDLIGLLILGAVMFVTDLKDTSLLIFILLVCCTLAGMLERVFTPMVLNAIGKVLSKLQGESYSNKSYNELSQSSRYVFFFALTITTLKNTLSILFLLSCVNLI